MENKRNLATLLHLIFAEDKAEHPMPILKAQKLLDDMKEFIEKYSEGEWENDKTRTYHRAGEKGSRRR